MCERRAWEGWNLLAKLVLFTNLWHLVSSLGSMSSIAISYGEGGSVFCGLKSDGSHLVGCYGSNAAILYGTPAHFQFIGLTGGDGFMCGLLMQSHQPYCWGNSGFIQMGVPQPMIKGAEYLELSAGDYHLCGLRKSSNIDSSSSSSLVDCWGYNMTRNFVFDKQIHSLSAGSEFNCGLSSKDKSVFCWGDENSSQVISLIPKETKFQKIAAGGYHVCGILDGLNSRVLCWGKSLEFEEEISGNSTGSDKILDLPPKEPLSTVVGGKFYACGIKRYDHSAVCWGFFVNKSTTPPRGMGFYDLAAGNYFTCGVPTGNGMPPVCWGLGFPASIPLAVSPGLCREAPCPPGSHILGGPCKSPGSHICLPCSSTCPPDMYQKSECTERSDQICAYNCSTCVSPDCSSNCSSSTSLSVVSISAVLYVRYRLRHCRCSESDARSSKDSAFTKDNGRPDLDKLQKRRRARVFTYEELEKAAEGFKEESIVGKGASHVSTKEF
ncbi:hypothetical protein Bca52824_077752 [Brassica carinata]|uniref:non-specific serine/threonine protein kinase n=1 Tax=Brassica carinata TaxID=52824 RepID=A0A8X7PWL9_BRACI|nr:hypothetical protein Bca52824_077752 [Brassica carinata]